MNPDLLAEVKRLRGIITQVQHLLCDMSGDDWRVNDALDLIDKVYDPNLADRFLDHKVIRKCPVCIPHPEHGQPDCISEYRYSGAKKDVQHRRDECLLCGWSDEYMVHYDQRWDE